MSEEQPEQPEQPVEQQEGGEEAPPQEPQEGGEGTNQEGGDAPAEQDEAPAEGEGEAKAEGDGEAGGESQEMMSMDFYDFDTVRALKKKHRDANLAALKSKREAQRNALMESQTGLKEALEKGQNVVYLEVCDFCEDFLWCTHHKQAKYWNFCSLMKAAVTEKLGENWYCAVNTGKVRLGAFEVTYNGKTMFSKLERMIWPRCSLIADEIKAESEGGAEESG